MSKQETKPMPKFMQSLDSEIHDKLLNMAHQRGISLQDLIRAVIIPDWLKEHKE